MTLPVGDILKRSIPVEVVAIELLDRNPVQTQHREEAGIKDLAADFAKTLFVQPITVQRKRSRYTVIDGHRRLAACRLSGFPKVPVIVLDNNLTSALLFLILNRDSKAVNAAQVYYAWANSDADDRDKFLAEISGPTRRNIQQMVLIFGKEEAIRLADGKLSPHIAKFIQDARNIFVADRLEAIPDRQIGRWVIQHAGTNVINRLRRDPSRQKSSTRKLHRAILNDESLTTSKKKVARAA